jgi:hypothetical protein
MRRKQMEVLSRRTCLRKDLTQLEEQAGEAEAVEYPSPHFAEVLEEEVTSSAEAVAASHMAKRVYQAGGNHEYTSAVEGLAVVESRVKQPEVEEPPEEVKGVATKAGKVYLSGRLST